jgi:hypothetical protein
VAAVSNLNHEPKILSASRRKEHASRVCSPEFRLF